MAAAATGFTGSWKLTKNENFDAFLKALNVSFPIRKMAGAASPVLDITQDGDNFTVVRKGMRTHTTTFTVGEEFTDSTNPSNDKEVATFLATWEGEKLKIENKSDQEGGVHMVREIVDGQMVQTMSLGIGEKAVVCKRIFNKTKFPREQLILM